MCKLLLTIILLFFLVSCGTEDYKIISNIPEASGICYMNSSNSFFIANDEGSIYEIDKKGNILNKKYIGNYDFEGIICDNKNNIFYILQENNGTLFKMDPKKLDIISKYKIDLKDEDIKKYFGKKSGAEGLAFDGEYFYLSTQKDKNNLLKFKLKKDKLELLKVYDIDLNDLSGLTILNNDFYIISDKNELILKYDLKNKKNIQKIHLKKGHWEGITFDNDGNIYLSDDDGFVVKL